MYLNFLSDCKNLLIPVALIFFSFVVICIRIGDQFSSICFAFSFFDSLVLCTFLKLIIINKHDTLSCQRCGTSSSSEH